MDFSQGSGSDQGSGSHGCSGSGSDQSSGQGSGSDEWQGSGSGSDEWSNEGSGSDEGSSQGSDLGPACAGEDSLKIVNGTGSIQSPANSTNNGNYYNNLNCKWLVYGAGNKVRIILLQLRSTILN